MSNDSRDYREKPMKETIVLYQRPDKSFSVTTQVLGPDVDVLCFQSKAEFYAYSFMIGVDNSVFTL